MIITRMAKFYYSLSPEKVLEKFNSQRSGLSAQEAGERLKKYGANVLPEPPVAGWATIFFSQFLSPLIIILLIAAIIILVMGEGADAGIIFFVLLFNAIVGAIQEGKAQNTLLALKKFVSTNAAVWRDGKLVIIPDSEVVPGDIISLAEGDKVPADARLLSANSFKVNEASFTGESVPASKTPDIIKGDNLSPQKQRNIVFKGTHVVGGNALAVVISTGTQTEIGKISQTISKLDTEMPLKAHIRLLSQLIIIAVAIICSLVIIVGVIFGHSWVEMFSLAVSLAVSVIPEGLPIVMTLVLASGVWRMARKQVLIKKLPAVEALGQARIIAVDKTGTLTKNELIIEQVYVDGKTFQIKGDGYNPIGEIFLDNKLANPINYPELVLIGRAAAFSSSVRALYNDQEKVWQVAGDPTEAAMDVFAKKVGFQDVDQEAPLLLDLPFDHLVKYHATVRSSGGSNFLSLTGAPEVMLEKCTQIFKAGKSQKLSAEEKTKLIDIFLKLSSSGLRIIACAVNQKSSAAISASDLPVLTFVGFLGMKDALRAGVSDTVRQVTAAGMKVVMITGDHPATALAIAKEAGITNQSGAVVSGDELDKLPDGELMKRFSKTSVFARVTPDHKLRIIELFRRRGEVVAMTGDGVNDAPSLAAADLGVAMGKIGTEVAKEAADIVLLDDNFSNIVAAAEEGRNIYKTIKRVILYLFSSNLGEVFIIGLAVALDWPLPLLAAQIIWLNFVTDGFLDVSLAMEKKEEGLLARKFSKPPKYILDRHSLFRLLMMSLTMAAGSLSLFFYYLNTEPIKALTVSLTVMAAFQWFNAWNCKSERKSIFSLSSFNNRWLILATILVVFLQVLAVYIPFFQGILRTVPLDLHDWLVIVLVASLIIWPEEIRKLWARWRHKAS